MKLQVRDEKLTYNGAQCLKCDDIIVSTHRHDFRYCKCGTIFVDGGYDYARAGGDFKFFKNLSKYEEFVRDEFEHEKRAREEGRPLSWIEYVDQLDPITNLPMLTSL